MSERSAPEPDVTQLNNALAQVSVEIGDLRHLLDVIDTVTCEGPPYGGGDSGVRDFVTRVSSLVRIAFRQVDALDDQVQGLERAGRFHFRAR